MKYSQPKLMQNIKNKLNSYIKCQLKKYKKINSYKKELMLLKCQGQKILKIHHYYWVIYEEDK